jgi:anti-anti-sigma factor
MANDQLAITTEILPEKQITLMRLTGNLDAHSFEQLQETLTATFDKKRSNILLDLSDVPYMSSAGAGVLIGAFAEAERLGGKLVIYGPRTSVHQVFNVLGIADVFTIVFDRPSAIAAF